MIKKILNDKSFKLSINMTLIFSGTALLLLLTDLAAYGVVLFVWFPTILGISLMFLSNRKYAIGGSIVAMIIFLLVLVQEGLSGAICMMTYLFLFTSIISIICIFFYLLERYYKLKSQDKLTVLLLPLILFFIAAPLEKFYRNGKSDIVEVRTEQVFDYTPEQVYDAIKSVDTLVAEKPFLMKFDLPVPTKCVLEKEAVGGLRTCYFNSGNFSNRDFGGGTITERITALERGKILKMDVIDYNLTGRTWLGFKEAAYYFDKVDSAKCRLTRITTYTSKLTPRFYWELWEKLGISQEHEYVFRNLANDLRKKYGAR